MKKILSIAFAIALPVLMTAQADVVSAFNANEKGDYDAAAEFIEKAMSNEKATSKDKTWRYRGDIYRNIAMSPEHAARYPDAIQKSYTSYLKAIDLDKRGGYEREHSTGLALVLNQSLNNGIKLYNDEAYTDAAKYFLLTNEITTAAFDSTFVLAVYNAGLSFEKAGDLDRAIEYYSLSAEEGYLVPDIYVIMVSLLSNAERTDDALAMAKMAREKHPRNKGLILEELNIYLREGKLEEALANLEIAVEEDPQNDILVFSKGSVLDNLGRIDEARAVYETALEINPDNYDALYNLGAMYFNKGAEKINMANEVPPKQQKLYNQYLDEAKDWFMKAQPIFERAFAINSEDMNTVRSLRDIYARTGEDEKMIEMTKLLKGQ